jgi:hypothetical protein
MQHIWRRLVAWIQDRCEHNPGRVSADILEGCVPETAVQWCHDCGACRIIHVGHKRADWRKVLRYDD